VSVTELRYSELDRVLLLPLVGDPDSGNDVVVQGVSDGDLVFLRATCPFSYEVDSWYGQRFYSSRSDVPLDAGSDSASVVVACYGKMYGSGLLADQIRLEVFADVDRVGGLYVSSLSFTKWPADVRPGLTPRDPGCPRCGHRGDFVRTALCCPQHGPFAGF
jgi:hypothetical protein